MTYDPSAEDATIEDIARAFASGALLSSVMEGANAVSGTISNAIDALPASAQMNRYGKQIVAANAQDALLSEAFESAPETQSYALANEYKNRMANGGNISNRQWGRLAQANENAIFDERNTAASNEDAARLLSLSKTPEAADSQAAPVSVPRVQSNHTGAYQIDRFVPATAPENVGKNGVAAFSDMNEGLLPAQDFTAQFSRFYDAGRLGVSMKSLPENIYENAFSPAQAQQAYNTGVNDANQKSDNPVGTIPLTTPVNSDTMEPKKSVGKAAGIFNAGTGTRQNYASQDDINAYVDYALFYPGTNDVAPAARQKESIVYGKAEDNLVSDLKRDYGVDVSGKYHILRDNDIRHIINSHGLKTNEKYPVTAEDIKKIPEIVASYDNVYYVKRSDGRESVIYQKAHNGVTYYLEQINPAGNILQNKLMIKVATGTIPRISGLSAAIDEKNNARSGPDGNSPRMYVQTSDDQSENVRSNAQEKAFREPPDAANRPAGMTAKPETIGKASPVPTISQPSSEVKTVTSEKSASAAYGTASITVAKRIQMYIDNGVEVSPAKLYEICDEIYGGTQAEGKYTIKDAYDAMELAVNRYILNSKQTQSLNDSKYTAARGVTWLENIMSKLVTQTKCTDEQITFQQFSTPPSIAYLAGWAANVNSKDTVLEPSAGIGGLAVFPKA